MQLLHNIYLGQLETKDMKLKAILAQLDYRHQINVLESKGHFVSGSHVLSRDPSHHKM